jgi:sodium transport system ATP-binding protein
LRKEFQATGGTTLVAVDSASFEVNAGEIFGLLGPNGAGKTTLLRMLATIITPTQGRCWIAGHPTHEAPDVARRQVGFLSGNTKLYGRLTPREILRYFGRLYELETDELAQSLNMMDFMDRRCETLSTGQAQKVSISRVLLHDPAVLILDEPTLGLDIMASRTILDFIRDAKTRNHSIIFSTHYMTEAESLCDRIGLIYSGRILALGTRQELYNQTRSDSLEQAFLAFVDERTSVV